MTNTENQLSVLIADDSSLTRDALRAVFSQCDAVRIVGEAVDVPQAIQAVQTLQPDLLILDAIMPGGSGYEVMRRAKQLPSSPVVILFSNFFLPYMKTEYGRAGADFLYDKAMDFEALRKTVTETARAHQRRRQPDRPQPPPSMKVLLIEDNPIDSKLFAEILRNGGCEVVQAESAEDALLLLPHETVDVILTDVLLPGIDGLSLANQLKAEKSTRQIPIIAMSAETEWPFARIALNYGCHGFLQKPLDTRHLTEQINRSLAGNQTK